MPRRSETARALALLAGFSEAVRLAAKWRKAQAHPHTAAPKAAPPSESWTVGTTRFFLKPVGVRAANSAPDIYFGWVDNRTRPFVASDRPGSFLLVEMFSSFGPRADYPDDWYPLDQLAEDLERCAQGGPDVTTNGEMFSLHATPTRVWLTGEYSEDDFQIPTATLVSVIREYIAFSARGRPR